MAATVEQACAAKLAASTAVTDVVGPRIYPAFNTQEPVFPEIVFTKLGGEAISSTMGRGTGRGPKSFTVRFDCYAATEAESQALGKLVEDAITPGGVPWRDLAEGVQGAFFSDSSQEFTQDGVRFQAVTFTVIFSPP